jgi:hypothetical protein
MNKMYYLGDDYLNDISFLLRKVDELQERVKELEELDIDEEIVMALRKEK